MEKQVKREIKGESLKDSSSLIKIMSAPKHKTGNDAKALMYQRAAEISKKRAAGKSE